LLSHSFPFLYPMITTSHQISGWFARIEKLTNFLPEMVSPLQCSALRATTHFDLLAIFELRRPLHRYLLSYGSKLGSPPVGPCFRSMLVFLRHKIRFSSPSPFHYVSQQRLSFSFFQTTSPLNPYFPNLSTSDPTFLRDCFFFCLQLWSLILSTPAPSPSDPRMHTCQILVVILAYFTAMVSN